MDISAEAEPTTNAQNRESDTALLSVKETARFLNVTVSWIYEHVRPEAEDQLPVLKLGKYLRFDIRDLRAYVDTKRQAAQGRRRKR